MLAPDAYYNMAQTYSNLVNGTEYDQGSTRQAISYYEDFLILFPQSSHLGQVESNLIHNGGCACAQSPQPRRLFL